MGTALEPLKLMESEYYRPTKFLLQINTPQTNSKDRFYHLFEKYPQLFLC